MWICEGVLDIGVGIDLGAHEFVVLLCETKLLYLAMNAF